ncbi:hypothetical protein LCGC14_0111170 [marine sediment metagenome]|jgi:hypothetical protein|uniref:Uncharacterized protein n=1 Tax=marine sediment metagenome TaxID=412755 RepID=A0A0F9V9I6_9ZZZZ
MVSAPLFWGDAPDQRYLAARSSFDAGAGLLLLLHLQGAFEEEVPTPVTRTGKEEIERESSLEETQHDSEVEELSDAERARRDAVIEKLYADMGMEPLSKVKPDVMATDDVIADSLAEVLGKPRRAGVPLWRTPTQTPQRATSVRGREIRLCARDHSLLEHCDAVDRSRSHHGRGRVGPEPRRHACCQFHSTSGP